MIVEMGSHEGSETEKQALLKNPDDFCLSTDINIDDWDDKPRSESNCEKVGAFSDIELHHDEWYNHSYQCKIFLQNKPVSGLTQLASKLHCTLC